MIRRKLLAVLILGGTVLASVLITGCASKTPAESNENETVKTQEVTSAKPAKETPKQKKEPEDPPNIKFAKELQKYLEKGDRPGAIAHFANIPESLKDDIDLNMLLGALYYSDAQYDEAIGVANNVLAIEPDNLDAMELISLANKAKGDKAAYKATAEQILSVDPYNPSVNIQKAEEYAINKKYKMARESYKKALKGDSSNKDAMFGYAQMSFYTDDLKTSREYFQKLLDIDPDDSAALAYMGKIENDNENYLKASQYIEKALKIDSSNYDYWMDYGTYLRYLGKFEAAAKAWNKAAEIDPDYFLAYAYLAGNYDDLGKWDLALENYHNVIRTNPKYFYAYESAAILEYHTKNYKEAIKLFTKTTEYSDNWCYYLMIAACYFKLNDPLTAKKILQGKLKKLDQASAEYALVRFYLDSYSKNAETNVNQKIGKETNSNKRGKMLFYMGLYCELNKADDLAKEYYGKVTKMQAPMFFEYRMAEWGLEE